MYVEVLLAVKFPVGGSAAICPCPTQTWLWFRVTHLGTWTAMRSPCGTKPCWPPSLEPHAAAMLKRRCHIRFPPPHLPSLSSFLSHSALPLELSLEFLGERPQAPGGHLLPPGQTGLPTCAQVPIPLTPRGKGASCRRRHVSLAFMLLASDTASDVAYMSLECFIT